MIRWADAHLTFTATICPPDYVELITGLRGQGVSQDPAVGQQGSVEERIGMLDESGVDFQILSLGSNVP